VNDFSEAEVRENYPQMLDILISFCRNLLTLPLDEMAAANEHWQTTAPIIEPTAYQRGGMDNLRDQRRVIDAAAALRRVLLSLDPSTGRSAPRRETFQVGHRAETERGPEYR
jgi:hypothetical protein